MKALKNIERRMLMLREQYEPLVEEREAILERLGPKQVAKLIARQLEQAKANGA